MLGSEGLDMILGMRWLANFKGTIQCAEKSVALTTPSGDRIEVRVSMSPNSEGTVYHVSSGSAEDIRVVKEFTDVFPEDLLGMPPEREIEFVINLLLGTAPISKRPYRMVVNELQELKKQLRELQSKGCIRPSSSPWGAPVIFVEKKDGTQRMCRL